MRNVSIIVFIVGLWALDSFGQVTHCDSLYTFVDQMPIYGKGNSDVLNYLTEKLKFNEPCQPEKLKQLTWTIDKGGKMVAIDVVGLEGQCRTSVIEQLEAFPIWTPGRLNGKLVCVKMTMPIHIRSSH